MANKTEGGFFNNLLNRRKFLKTGVKVIEGMVIGAGTAATLTGCKPNEATTQKQEVNLGEQEPYISQEMTAKIENAKRIEGERRKLIAELMRNELINKGISVINIDPNNIDEEVKYRIDTGEEKQPVNLRSLPNTKQDTLFFRDSVHEAAGQAEGFPYGAITPSSEFTLKVKESENDELTFAVFRFSDVDNIIGGNLREMAKGEIFNIEGTDYIFGCNSRGKSGLVLSYMKKVSTNVDWQTRIQ